MEWVLLLGRVLFGVLFIMTGVTFHLLNRKTASGYARMMGAPAPDVTVVLTGIQILVAGVLVVLGLWVDLAALLIVLFLIPTNYWMHAFWKLDDPDQRQMQQTHFTKNTALIGGALILFFLYYEFGTDFGLNLGDPSLFN